MLYERDNMSSMSPRKEMFLTFIIIILFLAFFGAILLASGWIQEKDPDRDQDNEGPTTANDLPNDNITNNDDHSDSEDPILDHDESEIILEIIVADDDVRTREKVNYSVENAPYGSNITWDMGDGNVTYGEKIIHSYDISSYYIINVTAIWGNKFAKTSTELGVKNRDGSMIYSSISKKIGIIGQIGVSIGTDIMKGISIPEVIVTLELYNFTGSAYIGVSILERYDNDYRNGSLRNDSIEGRMEEYSISWEITSEELGSYENIFECFVNCWLEWTSTLGYVEYEMDFRINY